VSFYLILPLSGHNYSWFLYPELWPLHTYARRYSFPRLPRKPRYQANKFNDGFNNGYYNNEYYNNNGYYNNEYYNNNDDYQNKSHGNQEQSNDSQQRFYIDNQQQYNNQDAWKYGRWNRPQPQYSTPRYSAGNKPRG